MNKDSQHVSYDQWSIISARQLSIFEFTCSLVLKIIGFVFFFITVGKAGRRR